MNLIDLHTRRDRTLIVPPGTEIVRTTWNGLRWRALQAPGGVGKEFRLRNFLAAHPVWSLPDNLGWYAATDGESGTYTISFVKNGSVLSKTTMEVHRAPSVVKLNWPSLHTPEDPEIELVIDLHGVAGKYSLLVHRMMSRDALYKLAVGMGVEIGPGPRPQIIPSETTRVLYIEETPPEKWAQLYDGKGKFGATETDWSNIRVGLAHELPVDDGSLDFIFLSHVFEHLANPIGHLDHWRRKLAKGGVVLAVVPDICSTKDRYMRPSSIDELLEEYDAQNFDVQPHHFQRFVCRDGRGAANLERARDLQARGESIHVHFYDRSTIMKVLCEAVERIDFASLRLFHENNHKDFYFVLKA